MSLPISNANASSTYGQYNVPGPQNEYTIRVEEDNPNLISHTSLISLPELPELPEEKMRSINLIGHTSLISLPELPEEKMRSIKLISHTSLISLPTKLEKIALQLSPKEGKEEVDE